jgi:hypothetical protein
LEAGARCSAPRANSARSSMAGRVASFMYEHLGVEQTDDFYVASREIFRCHSGATTMSARVFFGLILSTLTC